MDIEQKKASYLHHTATTKYSCCVPALGDSEGASCVGLAKANLQPIFILTNETLSFFSVTFITNSLPINCFRQYFYKK